VISRGFLFLSLALLGGCASRLTVERDLTFAPRVSGLESPQKIVFVESSENGNDFVASALREAVAVSRFHSLVDLSMESERVRHLERMLASGTVRDIDSQWATLIVRVNSARPEYGRQIQERKSRRCVKWGRKSNCERYVDVPVYVLREECYARSRVQVIRIVDGAILLEKNFTGVGKIEHDAAQNPPDGNPNGICRYAIADTADLIAPFLLPHTERVKLAFKSVEGAESQMEVAITSARRGRFDEASRTLESIVTDPRLSPSERSRARYNLSLAYWAAGQRQKCASQLELVDEDLKGEERVAWLQNACRE
jgi:hypothetical protein